MDVDILLAEEIRIDAVALAIRAGPRQRCGHGLLHHLAEVPGHGELLATTHAGSLDEDDVAADRRPHQAYRNAWPLYALLDFLLGAELRHAQELTDDLRRDDHLVRFAFGHTPRLFSRDRGDL